MRQPPRLAPAHPLHAMMVRRRRPLMIAPPFGRGRAFTIDPVVEGEDSGWTGDLGFFLAAYAAGLLFFLVMLS